MSPLIAQGIELPQAPQSDQVILDEDIYMDLLRDKPESHPPPPRNPRRTRPAAGADEKTPELESLDQPTPPPPTFTEAANAKGLPVFLMDFELATLIQSSLKNTTSDPIPGLSVQRVHFHKDANRMISYGLRSFSYNFTQRNPYVEANHTFYGPVFGMGIFNPSHYAVGVRLLASVYSGTSSMTYGETSLNSYAGASFDFDLTYLYAQTLSTSLYVTRFSAESKEQLTFYGVRIGVWY